MTRALAAAHYVFLVLDVLLVLAGLSMLRAAEESAARGGGLLGGIGFIPIALGVVLAPFWLLTLVLSRSLQPGHPGV